jgi:hypothetical protein
LAGGGAGLSGRSGGRAVYFRRGGNFERCGSRGGSPERSGPRGGNPERCGSRGGSFGTKSCVFRPENATSRDKQPEIATSTARGLRFDTAHAEFGVAAADFGAARAEFSGGFPIRWRLPAGSAESPPALRVGSVAVSRFGGGFPTKSARIDAARAPFRWGLPELVAFAVVGWRLGRHVTAENASKSGKRLAIHEPLRTARRRRPHVAASLGPAAVGPIE